jgi:hypothetical protein
MSYRKFAVPLLVAGAVLAVAGVTAVKSNAQNRYVTPPSQPSRDLLTTNRNLGLQQSTTDRMTSATSSPGAQAVHMLATNSGLSIRQTTDGRNLYAHLITPNGAVKLHDGTHQLTNGGQITVRNGRIIADTHGVVQALKQKGTLGAFNPAG